MAANYDKLRVVLDAAYQQSAGGKGAERHAQGKDFDRQPILEIGRMVGPGFAIGQLMKKAQESIGMVAKGNHEAAIAELLGVIVYSAAAILLIEEYGKAAQPEPAGRVVQNHRFPPELPVTPPRERGI